MSGSMSCLTMVTQGYRVWVNSQGWRHVRFQTRVQDIPLTTSDARVLIEVATGVTRSWELKPGIGSWVLRPGNFFGLETLVAEAAEETGNSPESWSCAIVVPKLCQTCAIVVPGGREACFLQSVSPDPAMKRKQRKIARRLNNSCR